MALVIYQTQLKKYNKITENWKQALEFNKDYEW